MHFQKATASRLSAGRKTVWNRYKSRVLIRYLLPIGCGRNAGFGGLDWHSRLKRRNRPPGACIAGALPLIENAACRICVEVCQIYNTRARSLEHEY